MLQLLVIMFCAQLRAYGTGPHRVDERHLHSQHSMHKLFIREVSRNCAHPIACIVRHYFEGQCRLSKHSRLLRMYCPWQLSQHFYNLGNPSLVSPVILSSFPSSFFLYAAFPFSNSVMAEPVSQVVSESSAAEREFLKAAQGDKYNSRSWKNLKRSSHFEDWEGVEMFLRSNDRRDHVTHFLRVPVKDGTTSSIFKDRLEHLLPLGSPEITSGHDNHAMRGQIGTVSVLVETPSHCMPYVYLSLLQERSEVSTVVLVYATEDDPTDWLDEDDSQPSFTLVYKLLLSYMTSVIGKAKRIDAKIRLVEAALESRDMASLSDLLHQLNVISHEIRASNFEHQALFSRKAAIWVFPAMERAGRSTWGHRLREISDSMEAWQPSKQKERISELRIHTDDVRDELRQKREEERQKREDARQEREEIRAIKEQERLDESIRIAKETKRDSRTMRGIAWVTIAFLPATFVASFFGMNFFNGIAGNVPFDDASHNVWLFFAIAVPVSGVVLFTFYFWDEYERKKDEKKVDGEKTSTISS
jgi:Mg2+ and Co2+ transporter CorA